MRYQQIALLTICSTCGWSLGALHDF